METCDKGLEKSYLTRIQMTGCLSVFLSVSLFCLYIPPPNTVLPFLSVELAYAISELPAGWLRIFPLFVLWENLNSCYWCLFVFFIPPPFFHSFISKLCL